MEPKNIICRFTFSYIEYLICIIDGRLWWYRIKKDPLNLIDEVYEPMQRLI